MSNTCIKDNNGMIQRKMHIDHGIEGLECGKGIVAGAVFLNCCEPIVTKIEFIKNDETYSRYSKEEFGIQGIQDFCKYCKENDINKWRITVEYKGTEIKIFGIKSSNTIKAVYPETIADIDLNILIEESEKIFYENCNCDKRALDVLMMRYGRGVKDAFLEAEIIQRDKDIYDEWIQVELTGEYSSFENPVCIEGYTMERIAAECRLAPLGACNLLKLLRLNPAQGLETIKELCTKENKEETKKGDI